MESSADPTAPSAAPLPLTAVRRRDREKHDAWTRTFLERALTGVLATVWEGRPYVNSNLFVYDGTGHRLYLHTARTGRTPGIVEEGGAASFTAWTMGRLLPAPEALEFSVEYAAAVVFGSLRAVAEPGEKRIALELIMGKYAPHLEAGRDYRPITPGEVERTGVHALEIDAWSGKEKVVAPDFPGAYSLPVPTPPVIPATPMGPLSPAGPSF